MPMLCYAMPCHAMPATAIDTASLSAQAQRSGNSGVGFSTLHQPAMHLYRPLCSSQQTMNGDQGDGATHRGELSAFGWGTITVCAGTYNSNARPARGAGLALAVHDMWVGCAIKLECCDLEWSPALSRVISTICRVHRVDARGSA